MEFLVTLFVLIAGVTEILTQNGRIVCVYRNDAKTRNYGLGKFDLANFNLGLCTHLIYNSIQFNSMGLLSVNDEILLNEDILKFQTLKDKGYTTKLMFNLGGDKQDPTIFRTIAANTQLRTVFLNQLLDILQRYLPFEGFNLDWQYPEDVDDKNNLNSLLEAIRNKFPSGILSISVRAPSTYFNIAYDPRKIDDYVDFINVMAYNFHTPDQPVIGHHSAYYPSIYDDTIDKRKLSTVNAMKSWATTSDKKSILVLGISSLARTYTLSDPNRRSIGSPANGPGSPGTYTQRAGYLAYYEVCEKLRTYKWTSFKDPYADSMFAYGENQWVGYDDLESFVKKTEFAISEGLGGVMVDSIDCLDINNACYTNDAILPAIAVIARGPEGTAPPPTQSPEELACVNLCNSSVVGYYPSKVGYYYHCAKITPSYCTWSEEMCQGELNEPRDICLGNIN